MKLTIRLSQPPPSTNNLFAGNGKRRYRTKAYEAWAKQAGWEINAQPHGKIAGRVTLDIAVQRLRSTSDITNRIKSAEDLLVSLGIIEDDRLVDQCTARWANVEGCVITIESAEKLT